MVQRSFWKYKKVFLTGHTGFKGGWLSTWLLDMGADVVGYALKPETDPSFFALSQLDRHLHSVIADVRDKEDLSRAMQAHQAEIIFHLAAQPIVRRSYLDPVETFATNVMGTVHLLDAARQMPSVRAIVVVTSDKCYENREWMWGYRESDPMGGHDPYSASKGCAELATAAYRQSFFECIDHPVGVATVRAGNVIGGGDWAEDRLVPDAVRALHRGESVMIRSPSAIRPWQHVLEPVGGYLMLAERLYMEGPKWASAWNFGPPEEHATPVQSLVGMLIQEWGNGNWHIAPERNAVHEAHHLKLDCNKARELLGWYPCLSLEEAVRITMAWYRNAMASESRSDMYKFSVQQIRSYEARPRRYQQQ
jgi:CDP-glucose 4,6-dehydratase